MYAVIDHEHDPVALDMRVMDNPNAPVSIQLAVRQTPQVAEPIHGDGYIQAARHVIREGVEDLSRRTALDYHQVTRYVDETASRLIAAGVIEQPQISSFRRQYARAAEEYSRQESTWARAMRRTASKQASVSAFLGLPTGAGAALAIYGANNLLRTAVDMSGKTILHVRPWAPIACAAGGLLMAPSAMGMVVTLRNAALSYRAASAALERGTASDVIARCLAPQVEAV